MRTGDSARPFVYRKLSSEPEGPRDSRPVSIWPFGVRNAYVIVDPVLTYPPPPYHPFWWRMKQGDVWRYCTTPVAQFGSGFLVYGPSVQPVQALRYFPIPGVDDWYNITGGMLDPIDENIPYP